MTIKINTLEIENTKRVKAVVTSPNVNGLTVIGGRNNQGKTSVLDAIAWGLGGGKFKPSQPYREGSTVPPHIEIELSNGMKVVRKGKNSALKVIDPSGGKSGQQILDELIGEMALNIPKFMESSAKEKANYLLQILGIGDELAKLELDEQKLYQERLATGRIRDKKRAHAGEMESFEGVPKELISIQDLVRAQQEIINKNNENQKKRNDVNHLQTQFLTLSAEVETLKQQLADKESNLFALNEKLEKGMEIVSKLKDESTEEIEKEIETIEETNAKIRINLEKERAVKEANESAEQYDVLTESIENIRESRMALLDQADLPLPELSVENGEIVYQGQKWDNMSGSDQLKVSTAIVRKLNPECGFVLMDKLEQMDLETLNEFNEWLENEGLQVIATRVSTGDECSLIIEDGYVKGAEVPEEIETKQETTISGFNWKGENKE